MRPFYFYILTGVWFFAFNVALKRRPYFGGTAKVIAIISKYAHRLNVLSEQLSDITSFGKSMKVDLKENIVFMGKLFPLLCVSTCSRQREIEETSFVQTSGYEILLNDHIKRGTQANSNESF